MNQIASPFKLLDSYQQDDRDIFFGRDKEVNDLYNALSGVKQLLLYGPSGSGKTSLIECGLRNQFSDADWFALTIRRGSDLNGSFFTSINTALQEKIELDKDTKLPADVQMNFGKAMEQLFAERYQPVYLLFDQFEELLIMGSKDEKEDFFKSLNQLIRYKVPCRVILIMREDFIGYLSEFEYLCPSLFQHRFRLEKMGRANVKIVVHDILTAPEYRVSFDVDKTDALCEAILSKLFHKKLEIELAHVQIFLGELWDRAVAERSGNGKPRLHPGLIKDTDDLESVLDIFLQKQFAELEPVYGEKTSLEVLANMITNRNTKLQIGEKELQKQLEFDNVELKAPLSNLLHDLEIRRIIRTIGENKQYEISHDILAFLVGQSRTEDMKLREKAQEIYELFDKRTETLGQNELNNLQIYEQYRAYPAGLKELIEKSKAQIDFEKNEKERLQKEQLERKKKQLRNTRIWLGACFVLAIVAAVSGWIANNKMEEADIQRQIAQTEGDRATKALRRFQEEQAAKDILRFNELDARANTILEADGRPLAILDTMKTIYKVYDYDSIPEMKWINRRIDSIQNISDSFYNISVSREKKQLKHP